MSFQDCRYIYVMVAEKVFDIIDIFVMLKYENELEIVTSDINFNSVSP